MDDGRVADALLRHLAVALLSHVHVVERSGGSVPPGFRDLAAALHFAARHGQGRPTLDDLASLHDSESERIPSTARALSYQKAARALDVSQRTIRRLVADGDLPAVRIAGAVRIRLVDLEEHLAGLASERQHDDERTTA